ncbi:MAG: glycogen debranching enzyme N-terminal domain-containing protein [Chloroflexia bacterium]
MTPLVTYRDFHTLTRADRLPRARIEVEGREVTVRAFEGARPLRLVAAGDLRRMALVVESAHREETARGLDDRSDC